jgi:hypothetical protein
MNLRQTAGNKEQSERMMVKLIKYELCTFPIGFLNLKLGCLHPVACPRSGSGFPSNATLFQ